MSRWLPLGQAALPVRLGLLVLALAGCVRGGPDIPAPPLPEDLTAFDREIAEQIRRSVGELRRLPDDARLWRELGMLYHAHDQFDLAVRCYEQGRSLAPEEPLTHFYLALADQHSGRLDEALAGMRRVIELAPEYLAARWRLALLWLEDGNPAAALETLGEAAPLAGEDRPFHHALGRAHLQAGAASEAAAVLEPWLGRHPDDGYGQFLLGTAYRRLGRPDEARARLALGEGARPAWTDPWSQRLTARRAGFGARLASATGLLDTDPAQATESLERLRHRRPDNTTVLINLGIGYRRQARLEESAEVLREAVDLEPARGLAHFHLALTYSELAHREEAGGEGDRLMVLALRHSGRAVELQPTSVRSHAMHGEMLARAGRVEESVEAYRRAVRDPQDPSWLLRLGGLLGQLGRWRESVAVLEGYLQRVGEEGEGLLLLGIAQANSGNRVAARAALEQALRLSPEDVRVRQALAQLERAPGVDGRAQASKR